MYSKATALFFIFTTLTFSSLPPIIHACGECTPPRPPHHHHHPPRHHHHPPKGSPPVVVPPPVIVPPIIVTPPSPPLISPPVIVYPPPVPKVTCPIDALKLGLCLDVLGGIVHVKIGNPIENICCPVINGLVELEAAVCLCTVIRLKLLNLNVFLPLALQLLATCGMTPPPGFVCPPLV